MREIQIALDVDGVLRNFVAGAVAIASEVTGRSLQISAVTTNDFYQALGLTWKEQGGVMRAISQRKGFVTALPPYPAARQGVRRLRELGSVVCVTCPWEGSPWWCAETEAWLALHFGIDVVHHAATVTDKAQHVADLFVDDLADNVRAWLAVQRGVGVFWRTPHNTGDAVPWGAHTTRSWDQLYQLALDVAGGTRPVVGDREGMRVVASGGEAP